MYSGRSRLVSLRCDGVSHFVGMWIACIWLAWGSVVSAQPGPAQGVEQAVAWSVRDGDATLHQFSIRFGGCSSRATQAACNIVITSRGTRPVAFALHGDTSFAVDADGRVHRLRAAMIGTRSVDLTGFSSYAYIDAEPGLPNAVTLLFEATPKDPASLRVILSAGDRPRPLIVLNSSPVTESSVKPIGTTRAGALKIDLLECARTPVRLDCAIQVTNLQQAPIDVSVPLGFGGATPGTYRDEATPKAAIVDFKLGDSAGPPSRGFFRLPPGIPMRSSFSVLGLQQGSREGAIELSLQQDFRSSVSATFVKVPVAESRTAGLAGSTPSDSQGVTVQQGTWLLRLADCVQTNAIVMCSGSVTNGSNRTEYLDMSLPDSHLLLPDGQRVPTKLLTVGESAVSVTSRRLSGVRVDQDAKPPLRVVFTRTPRDLKSATVVLSTVGRGGRDQNAVFRDLKVTQGQMASAFSRPDKPQPRNLPLAADATTARLKTVLQGAASVLEKEEAAEQLWDKFKDPAARTFLVQSYREFLKAQIAAASGPQATVRFVCAGFDSLSRKAPCGRILLLAPRVLSLGDGQLYVDLVRLIASGRVGPDELGVKVMAGAQGATTAVRSQLMALLDEEPREFTRRETAGWQPQDIDSSFARVLQLMLGFDSE